MKTRLFICLKRNSKNQLFWAIDLQQIQLKLNNFQLFVSLSKQMMRIQFNALYSEEKKEENENKQT
jgi:hypothetical protein